MRRTKILATVGPAVDRLDRLQDLVRAGADGLRLNFSHGSDDGHRATLDRMHRAARSLRRDVAIVADLPGPKLRIGALAATTVELATGRAWSLDRDPTPGDAHRVGVELPSFDRAARPGDPVLLGDGVVSLRVERVTGGRIETRVTSGGPVSSHAGIYLPHARLRVRVFGAKDRHDASIAIARGVDFLALSFVRDDRDLTDARRWLNARPGGREVGLIAKIERAEALRNLDGILAVADGIMVARGDLGIEVPLERLALEQKRLVRKANLAGKFAIVATQMLLSMIDSPRPSRAEATDVANAVLDGADAVMLSEESAVGKYPVEAVRWLDRIATATEPAYDPRPIRELLRALPPGSSDERAVAAAAVTLADGVAARAIATPTHSGRTPRSVAALRPAAPVVAFSHLASTRRRLALVRGVRTVPVPAHRTLEGLRRAVADALQSDEYPGAGPIVLTAGYPLEGRPTNLVTLVERPDAPRSRRQSSRRR
jgi:pyruvate kinase